MPFIDPVDLLIDDFKCPPELTHLLTPMEIEEMVEAFSSNDIEKTSRHIDVKKARDFFEKIEIGISIFKMDELIADLKLDSCGHLRFEEICRLSVLLKTSGESRLQKVSTKLARNKTTPVAEMYHQAAKRNIKVEYVALEMRETSDVGLAVHLTQVS
jgi:hypothetical protein